MAKQYDYKPAYGHFCSQLKSFYDNKNMKPMDAFTDSIYHDFMRKAGDSEWTNSKSIILDVDNFYLNQEIWNIYYYPYWLWLVCRAMPKI